jgi:hypothetical protein
MIITVTGTIQRRDIGTGAWALVTENGETYEIQKGANVDAQNFASLKKSGQKVKVQGQVREDIMTLAAIGPVLEVQSFEVM